VRYYISKANLKNSLQMAYLWQLSFFSSTIQTKKPHKLLFSSTQLILGTPHTFSCDFRPSRSAFRDPVFTGLTSKFLIYREVLGIASNILKACLHRRFLSRQLDAIFVAPKLHQVSNMLETPAISRRQIALKIAPGLHVRF